MCRGVANRTSVDDRPANTNVTRNPADMADYLPIPLYDSTPFSTAEGFSAVEGSPERGIAGAKCQFEQIKEFLRLLVGANLRYLISLSNHRFSDLQIAFLETLVS
jgi:hypothetical protein